MTSTPFAALSTLSTTKLADSGAEISAYHASARLVFSIGGTSKLSVVDLSNPASPSLKQVIDLSGPANSVAVSSNGLVAVAVEGSGADRYTKGSVAFFKVSVAEGSTTVTAAGEVAVGIVPDSLAFTPDGSKLVVANEGEPNELYTLDPEGSISVITVNGDTPASSSVAAVTFTDLNGREAELRALGIRLSGKSGTSAAQDLEPEYVAISADGTKAYVTFQENNAIGVVNLTGTGAPNLASLRSLGVQDYLRGQANVTTYDVAIPSPGTTTAGGVVPGGGLSGLYAAGRDTLGRLLFLAPADRGPNGNGASKDVVKADGTPGTDGTADAVQPFLLPDYQARFYKLALDEKSGVVTVVGEVKLTQKDGKTPITGRSNGKGDQIPVDASGNLLTYDPYGADLESIVQDKEGNIWMSDEYRPAIYKFSPSGQLIERYVPKGAAAAAGLAEGSLGVESLPAEYAKRQTNRGFEGMAYDAGNGKLYAFVQSPLDDVGSNDGTKGSIIRILEVSAATGVPSAEYLYPMAGKGSVTGNDTPFYENKVDKIGDVAFDPSRNVFYVLERDSTAGALSYKQVFEVSLKGATNTLGNSIANEENLSIDSLSSQGIKLATKVLITNLSSKGYTPNDKPEGLALLQDGRLAVINDNDFGVTGLDGTTYDALSSSDKAKYALASDINGSRTYVYASPTDAKIQLGIVNFSPVSLDVSDKDNGINLLKNQNIYGLRMPDGIAAYQANGRDGKTQTFTVIANEGDARVRPDGDFTSNGVTTKDASVYTDELRAGVSGSGSDNRLKIIKDLGDYDTATTGYEQKFIFGGRSITILDSLGNAIWDSGDSIDRAAIAAGIYDDTRSDDKGSEPENLAVLTIAGRTYAFVGLERGTSSSVATFDISNPYSAYLVDFQKSATGIVSPEGMLAIPGAQSPNGKDLLLVSNEVSKDLAVLSINQGYSLQILHYYGESGTLGIKTAPIMGALIDKFDDQFTNTLVIGEGDSFIPGPWLVAGADPSLNALASIKATALGRPDIAIMNLFGTNVSALGNHEFDLGSPVLSSAFAASGTWVGAQFPFVTSNLDFSGDSALKGIADSSLGGTATNAFAGKEASELKGKIAPYTIVTKGGEKIGIVGATTWDLAIKSSPNGTKVKDDGNEATSDLQEVAAYVQASVNALVAAGVNKVVMVDQLDGMIERNKALAPLLSGVDVMVAGGGHERLGDSNDVAVPMNGHDANFIAENYPISIKDKDGNPTLIVTTDTEYSYLGRLVVNFDANGVVIPSALDSTINGAYAATATALKAAYGTGQTADEIIATSTIGKAVGEITSALDKVINSKDGSIYGYTKVYLEGDRVFGRAQEVNLGNLTADANLYVASKALSAGTIVTSLKNGGGIRASIGSVDGNGVKSSPISTAVKPAGAISQLDIENALRFDNKLMVFDTTPEGLLKILNYAAGLSAGNGGYAQIGGIRFSFDPSKEAGAKVQDIAIVDMGGNLVARIADNGAVLSDAPKSISMVTLNFMANGGDGYPIKDNSSNFRYLLNDGKVSAPIDKSLDFTAAANVPTNALGEQAALQGFLKAFHGTPERAYGAADTPAAADQRIQNLGVKPFDTVFPDANVPLLKPRVAGLKISELLTIGEAVGTYRATGTPDGMGAYLKDANTIRLLVQSEITKTSGYSYKLANGTELTGARIHYLDIDKTSSQVIGAGLAYNKVIDRAGKEVTAAPQISGDASGTAGFDRFCAANLVEPNSFGAGKGFVDRIHLLGEESSSAYNNLGGSMVALDVASGTLYAVPSLGFGSWEAATALDTGNTTQVALLLGDDYASASLGAPIYLYVGTKSTAANASFLERNGLSGGKLYVWVADKGADLNRPSEFKGFGASASGTWTELAVRDATKAKADIKTLSQADYDTLTTAQKADYTNIPATNSDGSKTNRYYYNYDAQGYKSAALLRKEADSKNAFLAARIEDLGYNPNKPSQVAFVATGNEAFDAGSDLLGTVYTLDVSFKDGAPAASTLKIVYDGDDAGNGTNGLRSPDNLTFSKDGFLYLQEDKAVYGADADLKYGPEKGSIWKLDPTSGKAIRWAQIDDSIDPDGSGGQALDKNDSGYKAYGWESSGIIDVSHLYGHAPGTDFFANVQTHGVKGGAIDEFKLAAGGQILKLEAKIANRELAYTSVNGQAMTPRLRAPSGHLDGEASITRLLAPPSLPNKTQKLEIGQTGIQFNLKPNDSSTSNRARAVTDLAPLLDGLTSTKKRLAYFSYDTPTGQEAPVATPFTYDPSKKAGARFYDLNGDGVAETVDLQFVDGGYGDKDGLKNGVVVDPSTVGVAAITAGFTATATALTVADPADSSSPASLLVRASLTNRAGSVNQVGYVALNSTESDTLTLDLLRERATLLFANLEATDVPSLTGINFQKDIHLINGQKLVFFEVVDTTLDTLLTKATSMASLGSAFRTLNLSQASSTSATASNGGNTVKLDLIDGVAGLGDLISGQSHDAPVLDFTALAGTSLTGTVTVGREANYNSTVGFYKIERADGAVRDNLTNTLLLPGQSGYKEAALRADNLFTGFGSLARSSNGTSSPASISTFADAGLLAPFATVANTGDTFFAFAAANSDGLNHFRALGNGVVGLEDKWGGFDQDFDDLIMSFSFTQVPAAAGT